MTELPLTVALLGELRIEFEEQIPGVQAELAIAWLCDEYSNQEHEKAAEALREAPANTLGEIVEALQGHKPKVSLVKHGKRVVDDKVLKQNLLAYLQIMLRSIALDVVRVRFRSQTVDATPAEEEGFEDLAPEEIQRWRYAGDRAQDVSQDEQFVESSLGVAALRSQALSHLDEVERIVGEIGTPWDGREKAGRAIEKVREVFALESLDPAGTGEMTIRVLHDVAKAFALVGAPVYTHRPLVYVNTARLMELAGLVDPRDRDPDPDAAKKRYDRVRRAVKRYEKEHGKGSAGVAKAKTKKKGVKARRNSAAKAAKGKRSH